MHVWVCPVFVRAVLVCVICCCFYCPFYYKKLHFILYQYASVPLGGTPPPPQMNDRKCSCVEKPSGREIPQQAIWTCLNDLERKRLQGERTNGRKEQAPNMAIHFLLICLCTMLYSFPWQEGLSERWTAPRSIIKRDIIISCNLQACNELFREKKLRFLT